MSINRDDGLGFDQAFSQGVNMSGCSVGDLGPAGVLWCDSLADLEGCDRPKVEGRHD